MLLPNPDAGTELEALIPSSDHTHATVCYVLARGRVLLQRRAPGRLWAGRLNGPGGKVAGGETASAAIIREVREETGLELDAVRRAGMLDLRFGTPPSQRLAVHVFTCERFTGRPRGGREGAVRWYGIGRLPFDELWPDMRYWLPLVLDGGIVSGTCEYDAVGAELWACRLGLEWPATED